MTPGDRIDGARLVADIPAAWREPALAIAKRLGEAGHRAWVVGGCVRDLVLGRPLKDLDLVSSALPDAVEELFERTVAVGKSFGIVVVVIDDVEIEVATFRRERGYSDRRRPDEVEFSDRPEVDARRRDFTCNALFLDPLDGTLLDPEGGLADLEAGVLRAVGDPVGRLREDGLRILRMARFLSTLGLAPAPGLLEAAREESASLDGVSPERVLDELGKIVRGPAPHVALDVLHEGGHAARSVPGWTDEPEAAALRPRVLEAVGDAPGIELGLAALLEAEPLDELDEETRFRRTSERVEALRASRDLRRSVPSLVRMRHRVLEAAERATEASAIDGAEERGAVVSLWRDPEREPGLALARAWAEATRGEVRAARLEAFAGVAALLDRDAPSDPVELTASDLMGEGIARGPELGAALVRARNAALGGAFADRDAGLEWVRSTLR